MQYRIKNKFMFLNILCQVYLQMPYISEEKWKTLSSLLTWNSYIACCYIEPRWSWLLIRHLLYIFFHELSGNLTFAQSWLYLLLSLSFPFYLAVSCEPVQKKLLHIVDSIQRVSLCCMRKDRRSQLSHCLSTCEMHILGLIGNHLFLVSCFENLAYKCSKLLAKFGKLKKVVLKNCFCFWNFTKDSTLVLKKYANQCNKLREIGSIIKNQIWKTKWLPNGALIFSSKDYQKFSHPQNILYKKKIILQPFSCSYHVEEKKEL